MRLIALTAVLAGAVALSASGPAAAKTYSFRATLGGTKPPTLTGSPASGTAKVKVDTATKRVSVDLDVTGIMLDQLDNGEIAKPTGPVHFHDFRYADDNDAILPLPYGAAFRATKTGFRIEMHEIDYAAGAKLTGSSMTIDELVTAMHAGRIVLDIHTAKFPNGEISGPVTDG